MKTEWKKRKLIGVIAVILSLSLLNTACSSGEKKNIVLELEQGTLSLIPLNRNAVRIQFAQSGSVPMPELIYTESSPVPEYHVSEDDKSLTLSLEGISVEFDKDTEALTFKDAKKHTILQEKVGGRLW